MDLRAVSQWSRLPREVAQSPLLEVFKKRLEKSSCSTQSDFRPDPALSKSGFLKPLSL